MFDARGCAFVCKCPFEDLIYFQWCLVSSDSRRTEPPRMSKASRCSAAIQLTHRVPPNWAAHYMPAVVALLRLAHLLTEANALQ